MNASKFALGFLFRNGRRILVILISIWVFNKFVNGVGTELAASNKITVRRNLKQTVSLE